MAEFAQVCLRFSSTWQPRTGPGIPELCLAKAEKLHRPQLVILKQPTVLFDFIAGSQPVCWPPGPTDIFSTNLLRDVI